MPKKVLLRPLLRFTAAVFLSLFLKAAPVAAGTLTTLYSFLGGIDGGVPVAGLVQDEAGVLYGVTDQGGPQDCVRPHGSSNRGCGAVFSFSPTAGLKTLVGFTGANGAHGLNTLLLDGTTLYGNTANGGADSDGVLFSVGTDGSNFTLLHQFNGTDGRTPDGTLQPGAGGVFYGITASGGPYNRGVLFSLAPDGTYTILHGFAGGADGADPNILLTSKNGTLVGSAYTGGVKSIGCPSGCGLMFSYAPSTGKYTILHSFDGNTEGGQPSLGSLGPGPTAFGVVGALFSLSRKSGLRLLPFGIDQGGESLSGPALAPDGSLIGVNGNGPNEFSASGVLYREKNGVFTDLWLFSGLSDGRTPAGQPLLGTDGTIYGTTENGGIVTGCTIGCGTIYQYTP
jgi:uncharacterized repeat protein (TIGR03803 family)